MWDTSNGMSATIQSLRNQEIVQIGAIAAKIRIAGLIQDRLAGIVIFQGKQKGGGKIERHGGNPNNSNPAKPSPRRHQFRGEDRSDDPEDHALNAVRRQVGKESATPAKFYDQPVQIKEGEPKNPDSEKRADEGWKEKPR